MMKNDNFLQRFKRNESCRTFVIAEAGVHHGGDINSAKKLILAAAQAGADAIKFQTYKSDSLVTWWAPKYWRNHSNRKKETQYDYFKKRDTFGFEDYYALKAFAREKNITFCSTPFDPQAVDWLNELDVPFWKIASADIDNYPLLESVVQTQKPIILSTGASYFNEINATVDFLKKAGVKELALLHCNLAYPTPDSEANLGRIVELRKRFPGMLIGYSDHTIPDPEVTIPSIAVTLGAQIIEKHFTLDRRLPEDDHYHSLDPVLLGRMIRRIKICENATALNLEITDSEQPARKNARRSLVARKRIPAGSILTGEMLAPKRPGGGISPSLLHSLSGRRVKQTLQPDQQICWEILE
jgi:N-acetylneuraminate synthase